MNLSPSATLRLTLLGPPRVARGERAVVLRSRKQLALLIYLAVEQRHSPSRDTLLALLWPHAAEAAARNNLRVALADLRRLLGDARIPFLNATRHTVQFDPASEHTLDVATFRALLAACHAHAHDSLDRCAACLARLEEAVALYQGPFLHGFALPDSSAFEEWAMLQREQLHQQMLEALATLTAAYERQGNHVAQCRTARRQLELEPWRESAYAQLMRGLWASGQRGAALEQYDTCRRMLKAELRLAPSPELTALYERLRAADTGNTAEAAAAPLAAPPSHNLPAQTTSFIGREAQLAALRQMLASARLVTLTGAGGCGKTRLALEVAATIVPQYADGVWLVDLAPLQNPALVPQAVVAALELQPVSDQPASTLLSTALRTKQLLLILDNCEHLTQACRQLAEQLLRDCPRLTILATSREVLRVAGEVVVTVPPLSTPAATVAPPERLMDYEGIRLFVERASVVSAEFTLTERNAAAVVQICQRLDGIPLALELAAARVRHMAVTTIAERLNDRFNLLTAGNLTSLRQHMLRAAIDWSYELLNGPEQACFRRLAVFAGGFTLQSAEEVVGELDTSAAGEASTINLLAQLIDKSLVVAEQCNDAMRYRLLETMRAYAHEKLLESSEADTLRDRHMAHFLQLAEQAEPQLFGDDQVAWLDRLETEHANLHTAIDWAVARGEIVAALRLVTALRYFWRVRGHYHEGLDQLLRLLAHPEAAERPGVHVRALNAAGYLQFVRGSQAAARELLEAALTIGRAINDQPGVAFALRYLSALANAQHAYQAANAYSEESLAIYRALGATNDVAISSVYLADVALRQGAYVRAEALYTESAESMRARRNNIALPYPLRRLGYLALLRGELERASTLCQESLRLNMQVGDRQGVAACLVSLAAIAAERLQLKRAAWLLGNAEALMEDLHTRLLPFDCVQHERVRTTVRAQLGEAAFEAAWAEGHTGTLEQLLTRDADTPPVPFGDASGISEADAQRYQAAEPVAPMHNPLASLSPWFGHDAD